MVDNDADKEPQDKQIIQFFSGNIHRSAEFTVIIPFEERVQKHRRGGDCEDGMTAENTDEKDHQGADAAFDDAVLRHTHVITRGVEGSIDFGLSFLEGFVP